VPGGATDSLYVQLMEANHNVIPYSHVCIVRTPWLSITIDFSKTDQHSRGRILENYVDLGNSTHCIVQKMEAYVQIPRDLCGAIETD
jgi:hypothetical protein